MSFEPGEFRPIEAVSNIMLGAGIYHALYKASEYIGGETWGDNLLAHTKFVESISEDNRKEGSFRILLLGSATSTSIEQALSAIEEWKTAGLIRDGKLTVVDLKSSGYDKLHPELKEKVEFVKIDVRRPGFKPGSFDFITSDYLLNFIPQGEITTTIINLGVLLKDGGVFDATVDTKKRSLVGKVAGTFFVRNNLTKEQLDASVGDTSVGDTNEYGLIEHQKAQSRGLAKMSELGADRIVWGFKRNKKQKF